MNAVADARADAGTIASFPGTVNGGPPRWVRRLQHAEVATRSGIGAGGRAPHPGRPGNPAWRSDPRIVLRPRDFYRVTPAGRHYHAGARVQGHQRWRILCRAARSIRASRMSWTRWRCQPTRRVSDLRPSPQNRGSHRGSGDWHAPEPQRQPRPAGVSEVRCGGT